VSTHACLIVREAGTANEILLHTSHTGMDTLKWINEIPAFFANRRGRALVQIKNAVTEKHAAETVFACIYSGQYAYVPSVAALVIAVRPDCYEPVPHWCVADLPEWSGAKDPYVLEVAADGTWKVKHGKKAATAIDPTAMTIAALKALQQQAGTRSSQGCACGASTCTCAMDATLEGLGDK